MGIEIDKNKLRIRENRTKPYSHGEDHMRFFPTHQVVFEYPPGFP